MDIKLILGIVIPFALFILGGIGIWALRNKKAFTSAAAWLEPVLLLLVTEAEKEFGSGAGKLKLAAVLSWAIDKLPDKIKPFIKIDWLIAQIETALPKAKDLWKEKPALIEPMALAELEEGEPLQAVAVKAVKAGQRVDIVTAITPAAEDAPQAQA